MAKKKTKVQAEKEIYDDDLQLTLSQLLHSQLREGNWLSAEIIDTSPALPCPLSCFKKQLDRSPYIDLKVDGKFFPEEVIKRISIQLNAKVQWSPVIAVQAVPGETYPDAWLLRISDINDITPLLS